MALILLFPSSEGVEEQNEFSQNFDLCYDGAHGNGVQNVTSNCNAATLISFFFSLYSARRFGSGDTFILW